MNVYFKGWFHKETSKDNRLHHIIAPDDECPTHLHAIAAVIEHIEYNKHTATSPVLAVIEGKKGKTVEETTENICA